MRCVAITRDHSAVAQRALNVPSEGAMPQSTGSIRRPGVFLSGGLFGCRAGKADSIVPLRVGQGEQFRATQPLSELQVLCQELVNLSSVLSGNLHCLNLTG